MPLHVEQFRSSKTPWEVFRAVYATSKTCFFLDSPQYAPPDQIYSYIGMDPVLEVRLEGTSLRVAGESRETYPAAESFAALKKIFRRYRSSSGKEYPFFTGGFVGYFGYELAELCDKIGFRPKKELGIPRLHLGLFREVIVYDHHRRVYYLVAYDAQRASRRNVFKNAKTCRERCEKLKKFFETLPVKSQPFHLKEIVPEMPKRRFKAMVEKAKDYIAAGDIYQANLSQRFRFGFSGSPAALYGKLRAINPSPFSCFFRVGDLEIISSSPERLIRKTGRICETRPIAGTCPSGGERNRPAVWRQKLLRNPKERAEHLMLVDLERNDLGRVCDYRSVKVREFMTLEKYSHVVHIVSKITGRLKKGKDAFDLVRAIFPGGTITGCPKIRCMEIIDALEPVRRGIYTGSLGYIDLCGDMDLNIVIRTMILRKDRGHLQVGAGIVHDSDPEKEYEETLHKA
ncbi:MAG TPA: anthranilate synthase component I family protein, partial [Candidatus Omnitrophota bacterium]|nr:anthranilate synthase component I family protein [Candidatus Omnitrophota bacterium]